MAAEDKILYNDVLSALTSVEDSSNILASKIDLTPDAATVDPEMIPLMTSLENIRAWAQGNIDKIEQEGLVNDFLLNLKTLMSEYSARFELGGETGYGQSYGEGSITGMKVTVIKDGVTGERVIGKVVITSDDL